MRPRPEWWIQTAANLETERAGPCRQGGREKIWRFLKYLASNAPARHWDRHKYETLRNLLKPAVESRYRNDLTQRREGEKGWN